MSSAVYPVVNAGAQGAFDWIYRHDITIGTRRLATLIGILFGVVVALLGCHGACDPESERTRRAPECYCSMNCLPRCPTVAMTFGSRRPAGWET